MLGSGNFLNGSAGTNEDNKYKGLNSAGCKLARLCAYPYDYWDFGTQAPKPTNFDNAMKQAKKYNVLPSLLFEHYGSYQPPLTLGDYNKWFAIGKAFAERFRPNSPWWTSQGVKDFGCSLLQAMNEPDINTPIDRQGYHDALKGLADGAHSIDASVRVTPGGWARPNSGNEYICNGYATAVADLLNSGVLDGIDLHTYSNYWAPVSPWVNSCQHDFDSVKSASGITRDINHYCSELNYLYVNGEPNNTNIGEDAAAKLLLTCIWDMIGVVGTGGRPATRLGLLYNLFQENKDPSYDCATSLSPWTPTARARTYQLVAQLTAGMGVVSSDPKGTGEVVCAGGGKKLWAWQDRQNWSNKVGTSYTVQGIPSGLTKLDIYNYNGKIRTVDIPAGQTSLNVTGLTGGETYMFVSS